MDARKFVIHWLDGHSKGPVIHEADWQHFVSSVADACEAYHQHLNAIEQK